MLTTPKPDVHNYFTEPDRRHQCHRRISTGATNSTLSEVSGNTTPPVFTMPVWYSGGQTPLISPVSAGSPPSAGAPIRPHRQNDERPQRRRKCGVWNGRKRCRVKEMHGQPATQQAWVYFTGAGPAGEAASGNARPATRTYSNQDVARQEEPNGLVKYDSKTRRSSKPVLLLEALVGSGKNEAEGVPRPTPGIPSAFVISVDPW